MINDGEEYSLFLESLHKWRETSKNFEKNKDRKRKQLTKKERKVILDKTGSRCHICGGEIDDKWIADYVLSHAKGGRRSADNYLPSHKICSNYTLVYLPEELQEIMKIGAWARTEIEKKTDIGKTIAKKYIKYENQKIKRRKNN